MDVPTTSTSSPGTSQTSSTSSPTSPSLSTSATISTSSSTTSTTIGIPSTSTTSSESLTTATTQSSDTTISIPTTESTSSTATSTSTPTISTTSTTPTTTSTPTNTPLTTLGSTVISTQTSVTVLLPTLAPPSGSAAPSTHNGFFENKGAVAGVFTVVGLVVLALFIVLVTTIIRRRRAKEFDREVEAAAAEAAAAPAPDFLDDNDDQYRHHGDLGTTYTDYPQYSDVSSHGTYSQPPLGSQEAYNMRELGPAPGELYAVPYTPGGAAGAAGVGVARARSTRDPGAFASGFQEGSTPYPAFAGPAAFHSAAYGSGGGYDSLDTGVGVGPGAGDRVQRGMSLSHHQNADYGAYDQQQQQYSQGLHPGQYVQQSDLARNPSQATYNTASHTSSTLVSSAASPPLPKEQPSFAANYVTVPAQEVSEGAHGRYTDEPHGAGQKQEDMQGLFDDDEDEGKPRVLKVANE